MNFNSKKLNYIVPYIITIIIVIVVLVGLFFLAEALNRYTRLLRLAPILFIGVIIYITYGIIKSESINKKSRNNSIKIISRDIILVNNVEYKLNLNEEKSSNYFISKYSEYINLEIEEYRMCNLVNVGALVLKEQIVMYVIGTDDKGVQIKVPLATELVKNVDNDNSNLFKEYINKINNV